MSRMVVAFAAVLMCSTTVPANATVTEAVGGPGGETFMLNCPPDSVAVGMSVKAGAWIDGLALLCSGSRRGVRHESEWVGSTHSSPQEAYCGRGAAARGFSANFTREGLDPKYLDSLQMFCEDKAHAPCISTGDGCGSRDVRNNDAMIPMSAHCPEDEVMVGLSGRAGKFVDAVAAVCGPRPGLVRVGASAAGEAAAAAAEKNAYSDRVGSDTGPNLPQSQVPVSTTPVVSEQLSSQPSPDATIDAGDLQRSAPPPIEPPR